MRFFSQLSLNYNHTNYKNSYKDRRTLVLLTINGLITFMIKPTTSSTADAPYQVRPLSIEGIDIYLKDESTLRKALLRLYRLARSLFLYAICNGWVGPETTIIESSSGSTTVSGRTFNSPTVFRCAVLLSAQRKKLSRLILRRPSAPCYDRSDEILMSLAVWRRNWICMDQFTYAERAAAGGD